MAIRSNCSRPPADRTSARPGWRPEHLVCDAGFDYTRTRRTLPDHAVPYVDPLADTAYRPANRATEVVRCAVNPTKSRVLSSTSWWRSRAVSSETGPSTVRLLAGRVVGLQLTEVSVLGVRSSVTVFRHRHAPMRFVLIPTIHLGRPDYYQKIAERLARCQLVVAEQYDGPSSTGLAYVTALRLSLQRRGGRLVHQDIDYQALGVPTLWPDGTLKPARRRRMSAWGWLDLVVMVPVLTVAMAVGGRSWLMRRNFEVSDDSEPRLRWSFLNRLMLDQRDRQLVAAVTGIHEARHGEAIDVAVVFGAAHMPAVVRTLAEQLGYRAERGDWIRAIDF